MLVLEIEYLSGTCFAAIGPDSPAADWPPQPDRVYSALTATWALRGQAAQETKALKWLERLKAPRLVASESEQRTTSIAFVPPNDPRSGRQKTAPQVLPTMRKRQPRRFPAARPHDPIVRFVWPEAHPDPPTFTSLAALAHDTAYVGHSSSLTRCRFTLDSAADLSRAASPERWIYPGRFDELKRDFEAGRRPAPGRAVEANPAVLPPQRGVFDQRWLLLEHSDGVMPDIRAVALVSKSIRAALLSGYNRLGLGERIPEVVSGHGPSGAPSEHPHLAIIPLPFAGFPHADGHVLGFALVQPRGSEIIDNNEFKEVLRQLMPLDTEREHRVFEVTTRRGTPSDRALSVTLTPILESTRRSLDAELYAKPSRCFATVTPIVLDRFLKKSGTARQEELTALISSAVKNIGLPAPIEVVADKHSTIEGAPSAYPSGKSPAWMRWRLPSSLADRQLTHALIRFAEPVAGPVLLGAGRYVGMGLCRPLDEE